MLIATYDARIPAGDLVGHLEDSAYTERGVNIEEPFLMTFELGSLMPR